MVVGGGGGAAATAPSPRDTRRSLVKTTLWMKVPLVKTGSVRGCVGGGDGWVVRGCDRWWLDVV